MNTLQRSALLQEQLDVLRRIAERGLAWAQTNSAIDVYASRSIDLWQHLLDEIERIK